MITAPLTLYLLLMQISSPDFLLYSKPKQEILDRVIKISCCFVVTYDLEHLPRLPWDLFSPEEEDKTRTGEVFNNAGPRKGQRRFSVLWLRLRDRCRTPLVCRLDAHGVPWEVILFLAPRNGHLWEKWEISFQYQFINALNYLGWPLIELMFHTLNTEADTHVWDQALY